MKWLHRFPGDKYPYNCFFLFLKESKTKEKEMEAKESEIEFGPAPKRTR